jgi:hypothetical protein
VKRVVAVSLAGVWLAIASPALHGRPKVKVTGLYSNLHWVKEAGDVVGTEVLIVYSTGGLPGQHWAYVQIAEGSPSPPFLVKATVSGDQVEFTLPEAAGKARRFMGKVTEKGLVGQFEGSAEKLVLPRRKSYWQ